MDFVTVVSVGSEPRSPPEVNGMRPGEDDKSAGYVTVLSIGDDGPRTVEEVLVYRLPGERLGFGLKFEGGAKAAEFIKRLFIQSCAPDSPASRVECSWGKLVEGDEILEIDSVPVKKMTRINCVKSLKDSNVVIKLLVKHSTVTTTTSRSPLEKNNQETEKKQQHPPTPPPVPPRKVPRSSLRNNLKAAKCEEAVQKTKLNGNNNSSEQSVTISRVNYQSPRNSGRFKSSRQSPEASRPLRDRRPSEGSLGPPDAEVYLDLFSQESSCNLSESDDTGSTISTVMDRFSSYPTTTTSSLSGSLPSTPTAAPKHLFKDSVDIGENYLFKKLVTSNDPPVANGKCSAKCANDFPKNGKPSEGDEAPFAALQPPVSFQDAPLSYGNEDIGVTQMHLNLLPKDTHECCEIQDENGNCLKSTSLGPCANEKSVKTCAESRKRPPPPPPPPPRERVKNVSQPREDNGIPEVISGQCKEKRAPENNMNLPRLVDFVPKSSKSANVCDLVRMSNDPEQILELTRTFILNEERHTSELLETERKGITDDEPGAVSSVSGIYNSEFYSFYWNSQTQLDTIGEVEEDRLQESPCEESPVAPAHKVVVGESTEEGAKRLHKKDGDSPEYEKKEVFKKDDIIRDSLEEPEGISVMSFGGPTANSDGSMDALPTDSRQPPDGDEFPDCSEVTPVKEYVVEKRDLPPPPPPPKSNSFASTWKSGAGSSLLYGDQQSSCSVRDKIAIFSSRSDDSPPAGPLTKSFKSFGDLAAILNKERAGISGSKVLSKSVMSVNNTNSSSCVPLQDPPTESVSGAKKMDEILKTGAVLSSRSRSSVDLSFLNSDFLTKEIQPEEPEEPLLTMPKRLHTRSMSLSDISSPRRDRWGLLAEQRQNKLSKLKGLVIPEHISEHEPVVEDLPEIKSNEILSPVTKVDSLSTSKTTGKSSSRSPTSVPSLTSLPWSSGNSGTIPKYSPAFKRKSLQLYSSPVSSVNEQQSLDRAELEKIDVKSTSSYEKEQEEDTDTSLAFYDAPKSLESITSPTRSDYSFEYQMNGANDNKSRENTLRTTLHSETKGRSSIFYKEKDHTSRVEDDSDNDSAVSSSQSSYISKTSPPTSPYHTQTSLRSSLYETTVSPERTTLPNTLRYSLISRYDSQSHRLLKPQSVEAINRKNILASAKCRSGRDLKIGSPLIQRKYDEEKNTDVKLQQASAYRTPEIQTTKDTVLVLTQTSNSSYDRSAKAEIPKTNENNVTVTVLREKEVQDLLNDQKNTKISDRKTTDDLGLEKKISKPEAKKRSFTLRSESFSSSVLLRTPDSKYPLESSRHSTTPLEVNHLVKGLPRNSKTSVNDLKKNFEKLASDLSPVNVQPSLPGFRKLSLGGTPTPIKTESKTNGHISSQSSPAKAAEVDETSKKSPPSVPATDETTTSNDGRQDDRVVVLRPEMIGGSVGITLAGGVDYENKEITVYKVRYGSPAYREGSLKKGDQILFINGKSMKGLTHEEAVSCLKEPVAEISLVVRKGKEEQAVSSPTDTPTKIFDGFASPLNSRDKATSSPKATSPVEGKKGDVMEVTLIKDEAGLGFSLEGGRDSPQGDVPLLIKKVFKGGTADKSGKLQVGDHLVVINDTDVTGMSRFEAWRLMKKIPEGEEIRLSLKR